MELISHSAPNGSCASTPHCTIPHQATIPRTIAARSSHNLGRCTPGDITPDSDIERGFAVVAMLVGATVFGYVMGNIGSIVSQSNARVQQLNQKFELLNQYMLERSLPRSLQVRLRRYFRCYWSRRSVFTNEEEILTGLSSSLRDDVLRFIHREVITLLEYSSSSS